MKEKKKKSVKVSNVVIRPAVSKHLVNNQSCAESLNLDRFKTIESFLTLFLQF